ncbi:MAG: 2-oxoacid:ferredoxin oxidoreductase subunit beta [Planctomycetota bacterium]
MTSTSTRLDKKDFATDQDVRWCPGCGDYGILGAVQTAFAELGMDRDKVVIVSGIGCSSRFPYYMETYGFHTIHGRAPAVATGIKLANPELDVWVATGDGDGLSIGGNHLIHASRRNIGIKILLFNNRIYGLTKGQYSPTSEAGKVTKSTPYGSLDAPFNPLSLVIGAGASFVARSVDVMRKHLTETIKAAAAHRGTAFVEILQNCNIFNNGAFDHVVQKSVRDDMLIDVRDGEPLVFGKNLDSGLLWDQTRLRVVKIGAKDPTSGKTIQEEDLVVWNVDDPNPTMAFAMSRLTEGVEPMPIGILRNLSSVSPYETLVYDQIAESRKKREERSLKDLIFSGNTWRVG